jgi:hypothetical protein
MPSRKRRRNKKEFKCSKTDNFFSKTTTDTTSTSTSSLRLVSSITEEKEERSIYAETYSETKGEGATSYTSVNVSKQQSENTASSDPAL